MGAPKGGPLPKHLVPGNPGHKGPTAVVLGGLDVLGRTPSQIRASIRADFDRYRHVLADIAADALHSASDRKGAIDVMGKYGLGIAQTMLDEEGNVTMPQIIIRRETVDEIKHADDCPCKTCRVFRGELNVTDL